MNENNSRENYEKAVESCREAGYSASYWAMVEDGYSSDVDWKSLILKDKKSLFVGHKSSFPRV